jgi:hypothetical protein
MTVFSAINYHLLTGKFKKMKKLILVLLLLLPGKSLFGQEREWGGLIGLLRKEAAYFEGKSGFIQLLKSEYNTFFIKKLSVTDSQIVNCFRMRDRFGNEGSERYLEETVLLEPGYSISSAEIFYDYSYYFEDFPDAQFLLITFKDFPLVYHVVSIYKDLETGQEDKSVLEDTTRQVVIPIRRKSRREIFEAIDRYQRETLRAELYDDVHH